MNLQQNNVCSVEKFTQVWKFYTTAGCKVCEILHVCDGYISGDDCTSGGSDISWDCYNNGDGGF